MQCMNRCYVLVSPLPSTMSPTRNLVQPGFRLIVFLIPPLRLYLNLVIITPLVCSSTVTSHRTTLDGTVAKLRESQSKYLRKTFPSAAGDRIAYSLDPTSRIRVRFSVVPGDLSGLSVGIVRISRGWRMYVREWSRARM